MSVFDMARLSRPLRRVADTSIAQVIGWQRTRDLDGILGDVIAGVQIYSRCQDAVTTS